MITGELKSQIDAIWQTFWEGGEPNTMTIVEQLTYLIFIKDLDETEVRNERMAKRLKKTNKTQLELFNERPVENDRNYHLGGKSFYFFDFDDNVATLATTIVIFHKVTGHEIHLSSADFALYHREIGISGNFSDYYIDFNDEKGSFRNFRDQRFATFDKIKGKKQRLIQPILLILIMFHLLLHLILVDKQYTILVMNHQQ